jgi:uncharacterized paraquat-inducible protein A
METPEEFLKNYHNNLPNDWLFEKREVVARLIKEYTEQALREQGTALQSEQLDCVECDYMRVSDNSIECRRCGSAIDFTS